MEEVISRLRAFRARLLHFVRQAMRLLWEFLQVLVLGVIAALIYALPWIARAASLGGWVIGMWLLVTFIQGAFPAPTVPLLALSSVPVVLGVGWIVWIVTAARQKTGYVWGAFALFGLLAWIAWRLLQTANHLAVLLAPGILNAVLLLFATLRLRKVVAYKLSQKD